jgi:hypothetical protein
VRFSRSFLSMIWQTRDASHKPKIQCFRPFQGQNP